MRANVAARTGAYLERGRFRPAQNLARRPALGKAESTLGKRFADRKLLPDVVRIPRQPLAEVLERAPRHLADLGPRAIALHESLAGLREVDLRQQALERLRVPTRDL